MKSLLISAAFVTTTWAQSFVSGSTGADGALVLATPGTFVFNPRTFTPPLNPSGDNVYQFTSVFIGAGVTLKLSAETLNSPVFWLSQGPVRIDGTIDLDGAVGNRLPTVAGAGGFSGGAAEKPGYGPLGTFKLNPFLVPLLGGSGGAGGPTQAGGGGGGALLISSSASITVNGRITADGGASGDGVGGGGGAIRLVAPIIDGSGLLSARGGEPDGTDGQLRFEASQTNFSGDFNATPFALGKPFALFLPPSPPPSVRIVSAAGATIRGAELSVIQQSPITVVVEARHIPPKTVIELDVFSDDGSSQTINMIPSEGTLDFSRASVSLTLPRGVSHCYLKAEWKP